MTLADLPALNAVLNGISASLLTLGFVSIRRKKVATHRNLMIAALVVSALFLTSYLVHKAFVGPRKFPGTGWIRPVYYTILISHTILAVTVVPLALVTARRAWKRNFLAHRKIAVWTLPIWFYVSVTGVVIYFMLYRIDWAR